MTGALDLFHPLIQSWFETRVGLPTEVQETAWPAIASGAHVLATAPTGSGKTLTAFLWAINQLASGAWPAQGCQVLYVSPLKALNTDVRQNLIEPLAAVRQRFEDQHLAFPRLRVMTRSGDTPPNERRQMSLSPPQILITTPESLNLLISSRSGRRMLGQIRTVILDEIHACAGTKRGVHLITAVDRLVRLAGEFQRIGLSATLKDPGPVMEMLGGYRAQGPALAPNFSPRPVTWIRSRAKKDLKVRVCYPARPWEGEEDGPGQGSRAEENDGVWDLLAQTFTERIHARRSTLIFTNGRRLCEKLAFKVNQAAQNLVAYAHHGSLSRALRNDVEKKLRQGELKAIVATSSLEMGIDIGSLDQVIMVQSPPSVSSTIQRTGRAGHQVGAKSLGTIFPAHAQDLIAAAVLARAVADGDLEPLRPVSGPLDVLAQVLVSMIGSEDWDLDALFSAIRTSAPFRNLDRELFDLVIDMLAGAYAGTRIRELQPKIYVDRVENRAWARKGALLSLYINGGTIPDRGYYGLRHAETSARIGELDEEYVWEAKPGQIATVGSRNWKITRITHNDVFALPAGNQGVDAPFWIAETMNRDFHLSRAMGAFLEMVEGYLDQGKQGKEALAQRLLSDYFMDLSGARALILLCERQRSRACLPHCRRLVLEYVRSGPGTSPGTMLVIHTLWGGRVNRPYALALEGAWMEAFGEKPEVFAGNDAVVIHLPRPLAPDRLLALVTGENLSRLVRSRLPSSGFFAARFRENAGRALLLTRRRINQRMPLWMTRLHAQKLMENVVSLKDFPILLETFRTCLEDEFDLDSLARVISDLETGAISFEAVHTPGPSPFATAMAWQQINQYMYQGDQPAGRPSALRPSLIDQALHNEALRPRIPLALVREFEAKRQRLAPGYAPSTAREMLEWVKDRLALPLAEWEALVQTAWPQGSDQHLDPVREKLVLIRPGGGETALVAALDQAADLVRFWYAGRAEVLDLDGRRPLETLWDFEPDRPGQDRVGNGQGRACDLLGQWLGFYGPMGQEAIGARLGLDPALTQALLTELKEKKAILFGALTLDPKGEAIPDLVCDAPNFEMLVRLNRASRRPELSPFPLARLPLFLADFQGLDRSGDLAEVLAQLSCLPLPAELWETQVLPARVRPYYVAFLDSLIQGRDLVWLGQEKGQILFCLQEDLELLEADLAQAPGPFSQRLTALLSCFERPGVKRGLADLCQETGLGPSELVDQIWEAVFQGLLANDTAQALRKGIENRFVLPKGTKPHAEAKERWAGIRGQGRSRSRVRSQGLRGQAPVTSAMAGNWFRPDLSAEPGSDLVDRAELSREKARLLLDRYGILFRALLEREAKGFRWADLFGALYLMELAGEVVAGAFFSGIEGPQFATPRALRRLASLKDHDRVFWLGAMDPASACGLGPLSTTLGLPRRLSGNLLVYQGERLRMTVLRQGKALEIHAEPDDPSLTEILAPLSAMMTRQFMPLFRITILTINGEPAVSSPFRDALGAFFDLAASHQALELFLKRN